MYSKQVSPAIFGNSLIIFMLLFCGCSQSKAASSDSNLYKLDASKASKELLRDHLKMGGANPQGDEISFTSYYMEVNGTPVMPVIGRTRRPNRRTGLIAGVNTRPIPFTVLVVLPVSRSWRGPKYTCRSCQCSQCFRRSISGRPRWRSSRPYRILLG